MVSKKKTLNTKTNIVIMRTKSKLKKTTCWFCHSNGYAILDKFGYCKRCGTNLKKYPTRDSIPYPKVSSDEVSREVLGTRDKFTIPDDNDQGDW